MKTAISIPDAVFESAERYAAKTGVSRSRLYTQAIQDYLQRQRDEAITAKINEVCAEVDTSLDPQMREYQKKKLREVEW